MVRLLATFALVVLVAVAVASAESPVDASPPSSDPSVLSPIAKSPAIVGDPADGPTSDDTGDGSDAASIGAPTSNYPPAADTVFNGTGNSSNSSSGASALSSTAAVSFAAVVGYFVF